MSTLKFRLQIMHQAASSCAARCDPPRLTTTVLSRKHLLPYLAMPWQPWSSWRSCPCKVLTRSPVALNFDLVVPQRRCCRTLFLMPAAQMRFKIPPVSQTFERCSKAGNTARTSFTSRDDPSRMHHEHQRIFRISGIALHSSCNPSHHLAILQPNQT